MSEPTIIQHDGEPNHFADARGKRTLSLAKDQQLHNARESKKRKAQEAEERQREMAERLGAMEGLLQRVLTAPPQPSIQHTNPVQDVASEDEQEPEFPAPPRKRRRLLNTHRREPRDDYIEPAGWSTWTKVGTMAGIVVFNAVLAKVMSQFRNIKQGGTANTTVDDSNVTYG